MPVEDHLLLLSAGFLTKALQPGHVSHDIVKLPPGPRRMKETLSTKVGHLVEPYLVNGNIPVGAYKTTIDAIHTKVVGDAISNYDDNRVLNAPAPAINDIEKHLPRPTRAVLAQL